MTCTRIVAGLFAATGLVACSLYGGLDGFSSTAGDPDAATEGGDATASTTGDASPPEGGGDATSDADASTTPASDAGGDARYCAAFANEDLCADFEESNPLALWTKQATSTADVVIVGSGALSAPNAIRATAGGLGENRYGYFNRSVGNAPVDRARLSYALFVEQRPTGGEIEVNGLVLASTKNFEFYLAINDTTAFIVEQSANPDGSNHQTNYHPLGGSVLTGVWLRIVLDLTLSGTTKELVLSVGGTEIARKPLTLTGPGAPRVRPGITWVDKAASGGIVLVDDVRFDILP